MKLFTVTAVLVGLLLLTASAPAEITIVGPDEAEIGRRFDVDVDGLQLDLKIFQSKAPPQIEWQIVPKSSATIRSHLEVQIALDEKGKTKWVVVPYATITPQLDSRFGIVLMVVQNGLGHLAAHEVAVAPFPVPPPPPPPPPPPDEEVWGAILIEESKDRTPELAQLVTSNSTRKWMKQRDLAWVILDKDTKGPDGKPAEILKDYLPVAKTVGFPALIVVGEEGSILHKARAPPLADFLDLMTRLVETCNGE